MRHLYFCVFLLPALILIGFTIAYPLSYSFYTSFFSFNMLQITPLRFVGIDNYLEALSDPVVQTSIKNTMLFVAMDVSLSLVIGLCLALLLNLEFRGSTVYEIFFIFPWVISPIAGGLIWLWLYNPDYGLINYLLNFLGLPKLKWIGSPSTALISCVLVNVWRTFPLPLFIFLAALKSLPKEPYEAAKVDGASEWQIFKSITLPLLRPAIFVVLVLRTIGSFVSSFPILYTLTMGGPGTSTEVLTLTVYKEAFEFMRTAYAEAISWILFVISTGIAVFFYKLSPLSKT